MIYAEIHVIELCAFETFVRTNVFQRISQYQDIDSTSWMPHTQYQLAIDKYMNAAPTNNDTGEGSYTHKRIQGIYIYYYYYYLFIY